jgi:hypothetical protein
MQVSRVVLAFLVVGVFVVFVGAAVWFGRNHARATIGIPAVTPAAAALAAKLTGPAAVAVVEAVEATKVGAGLGRRVFVE